MSIDPEWLNRYQSFMRNANQALSDYMICIELEALLEKETETDEP